MNPNFIFHESFLAQYEKLKEFGSSIEELNNFLESIIYYGIKNEELESTQTINLIMTGIKPIIKASTEKYNKAKESGRRGGVKSGETRRGGKKNSEAISEPVSDVEPKPEPIPSRVEMTAQEPPIEASDDFNDEYEYTLEEAEVKIKDENFEKFNTKSKIKILKTLNDGLNLNFSDVDINDILTYKPFLNAEDKLEFLIQNKN